MSYAVCACTCASGHLSRAQPFAKTSVASFSVPSLAGISHGSPRGIGGRSIYDHSNGPHRRPHIGKENPTLGAF